MGCWPYISSAHAKSILSCILYLNILWWNLYTSLYFLLFKWNFICTGRLSKMKINANASVHHLKDRYQNCAVNGHRNADKRAYSFWQFLHFFSTELLVFLICRQTDKEFRLPWPSFVRVEIYYRYRLSINRKYRLHEPWIFHSEVVRTSASRPRGHEIESRTIHFPYQRLFFYFLVFLFFLNFEVKHCGNLY